jgi:hypothetical protein
MQAATIDPSTLWNMSPYDFNEWRAANDISELFAYFATILPHFDEWTKTLPFDSSVIVRIVPTGDLFKGEKKKVAIERHNGVPGQRVFECFEHANEDPVAYWRIREQSVIVLGEFEPYLKWAKGTLWRNRFFTYDRLNNSKTDTFLYGSWRGEPINGYMTSATLFHDFTVLKLGQVELPRHAIMGSRNLDFADLDFLIISEGHHGSYWTHISFSSCRQLHFINANFAFLSFYQCAMDKFFCDDSRIQDFNFYKTSVLEFRLTRTFVYRLGFIESRVTPFIENCELREVNFNPPRSSQPYELATTFRLLRSAYQLSGLRREAADCYYKERIYERKAYFHPYAGNERYFPPMPYGGRFSTIYQMWKDGQIPSDQIPFSVRRVIISRLKVWFYPKYCLRILRYKTRWLVSLLDFLIWGYGERPSRIFAFSLLSILSYALIFYNIDWGTAKALSLSDSLYFSIVTFTTLGYGDILPTTAVLKFICGSEALIGAFSIGLIVAGFSNRSKY